MKYFVILLIVANARAGPVVVEPIVPEVPVVVAAPVQEAVIAPKAAVVVPVVPEVNPVVVPVEEKKEVVAVVAPVVEDVAVAGENVQDPQLLLSDPIDKATKMIIDLDDHLRKYLPAEDEVATTLAPAIAYAGGEVAEVEPTPAERQNQMTALIDQVNRLAESIENTITDLVARRRYVTAAMLRSMLNYVRRVRVNLERLQNRLQSVQAVASVGQNQNAPPAAPAPIPGTAFFNTIRDRINRITEEIGALVSRIRGSFTPGGPSGAPLPPLATSAPLINAGAIADIGAVAA